MTHEELAEVIKHHKQSLADIHFILNQLSLVPKFKAVLDQILQAGRDEAEARRHSEDSNQDFVTDHILTNYKRELAIYVGEVEVSWEGRIERVCFPLSPERLYLRDSTKSHFENTVEILVKKL